MTKGYTNNSGEYVELSKSHLETAVKIKIELQKASPSRRCSWAKHKKMMESEGFYDSENSENCRTAIKFAQKDVGLLPEVAKYAEMVSVGVLDSIREEIGEIQIAKLDARADFLNLSRLKRNLHEDITILEEIKVALKDKDFTAVPYTPAFIEKIEKSKIIVGLSDFHYGALVDVEGYKYNAEIAEELLMKYSDNIIELIELENAEEVYVVGMGDMIEQAYMRHSQAFGIEGTLSEQITKASELLIKFLQRISQFAKVKYAGINGNHDRMSSKNDTIYSDGAVNIINATVKVFTEYSNSNVEYVDSDPYHHIVSLNGRNFLFVHGDITPIKKSSVLAEQSDLYGIQFDALLAGHIHHFTMKEVGFDRYVATFGSIKGSDEYSLKTIGSSSSRSQGIIVIKEDGEFDIRKIKL